MLTVGSLFSGIGGFDLGLERTGGFRTAWFCEQDEFCRGVLARHWPGVPCHPDITKLRHPEPVDVLCGGFPCQDLSVAGRGAGIDGARSGLWSEYARLVRHLRPRYVLVENVPALLARGLGRVLGDLAACGYDAEWDCVPASALGAPHRRDRLWLVAYPQRDAVRDQPEPQRRGEGTPVAQLDGGLRLVADTASDGRGQGRPRGPAGDGPDRTHLSSTGVADADQERGRPRSAPRGASAERGQASADLDHLGHEDVGGWWAAEPDVGRVADGVPARVDRLRALGNALIPQIPQELGRRVLAYEAAGRELAA